MNLLKALKNSGKKIKKQFIKPKVGVSYSIWDCEELLEASINSIRSCVDYINVVWQKVSWYGEPCSEDLESILLSLKEKGLIDELIFFEPNLKLKAPKNETNKRNMGLTAAKKAGCTHFLTLDADEFFNKEEFELAKNYVIKNGITHSACNQLMYLTTTCRITFPAAFFAPFLYKITGKEKFTQNCFKNSPWLIDPTKQIPLSKSSKVCFLHNINLHHFDKVRNDLNKKYRNSATKLTQEQQELIEKTTISQTVQEGLESGYLVEVKNEFGIKF